MDIWTVAEWVGRIGFVTLFVMSGINHLVKHKDITAYAQSKRVPAPGVAVTVTGLMMLAGGALILVHWHPIWGAGLLVLTLVPIAIYIHDYWTESDAMMRANQMAHFWKNITIAAGAVLYAVGVHFGGR